MPQRKPIKFVKAAQLHDCRACAILTRKGWECREWSAQERNVLNTARFVDKCCVQKGEIYIRESNSRCTYESGPVTMKWGVHQICVKHGLYGEHIEYTEPARDLYNP